MLRPPDINLDWLEADEFVIPGSTVLVRRNEALRLNLTPKAKYPSTDECIAPDKDAVVGLLSEKLAPHFSHHFVLFQTGDRASRLVFTTVNAFEALWSADSQHVAITEYIGKNSSNVLVVPRSAGKAEQIQVAPYLAEYFREAIIEAPQFQKAYRWSDGPVLVVRGVGRLPFAPFEIFGYEALVDTTRLGFPDGIRIVTAFIKKPSG